MFSKHFEDEMCGLSAKCKTALVTRLHKEELAVGGGSPHTDQ